MMVVERRARDGITRRRKRSYNNGGGGHRTKYLSTHYHDSYV